LAHFCYFLFRSCENNMFIFKKEEKEEEEEDKEF